MSFYGEISKYYDYIFPVGENQLNFIKDCAGSPGGRILDVACGSGGYSIELAKAGYLMTAVDIEDGMVEKVKTKAAENGLSINAFKCDMRELEEKVRERFNAIFCIGNSLVHLANLKEIADALTQMKHILADDGCLVLQTVNYDRIIKYNLDGLPTIANDEFGVEFVRKYKFKKESNTIDFNTTLIIKKGDSKAEYNNSVELLPLRSSELAWALKEAGFTTFDFYGDFKYSNYTEDSPSLVVKAR
ncbi:MAG TPA: class I SAM-dependent methyltransferase [Clostridium sp.]|nr:methyltransferase type 11 [Clostridium sp. Bc-iso-3]HHV28431.1 class I SAM-dependent methyltransferase [Clostridium sp.]